MSLSVTSFNLSIIILSKAGAYLSGALAELHLNDRLLALPSQIPSTLSLVLLENIGQGYNCLSNTLAYYEKS